MESESIISNVIWKFAERIAAQIVTLIVSIILARILLPDDFGAVNMVTVFITVANIFVTEGISTALIQKKDADLVDFSTVFYCNIALSVFIYAILFLCAPLIASFYGIDVLCPVVRVMGLRLIIASLNSIQHSYVSKNMMFRKYFWSTLLGTLVSGVVGVYLAYRGFGVWAIVWQYMTNTAIDTIVLFFTVKWRPTASFSFSRLKSLFGFGWKILFESVSNTLVGQFQNLLIGKVYTASDLAFYSRGQQFPGLIVNNISSSIGSVLFPSMANEQEDKDRVLLLLRKSVRLSSFVVYPLLAGLAAVAFTFVRVVLTDKWIETVPYLRVFCLLYAPTVGMIPRHQALNGSGRSDVFMYEHMIARIISVIILLLTYRISVLAILLGSIVGTTIQTIIIAYTSSRYNGYLVRYQIKDVLMIIIGCLLMGVPVFFMGFIDMNGWVLLFTQIITGIGIYYVFSLLFIREELNYCLSFLRRIVSRLKHNG